MHNSNIPTNLELPSTGSLIKSTVIAAIIGGVLLITVVMPAEYGIDPTGIGKTLGLKKMGEIKVSLAEEAKQEEIQKLALQGTQVKQEVVETPVEAKNATSSNAVFNKDEMSVTLTPNEGTEIKAAMTKGAKVKYTWWTDGGKANYDIHGDSKALKIKYHNYEKGSKKRASGELVADFDGSHGWFWRNRTGKTITVTIQTEGEYTTIKEKK